MYFLMLPYTILICLLGIYLFYCACIIYIQRVLFFYLAFLFTIAFYKIKTSYVAFQGCNIINWIVILIPYIQDYKNSIVATLTI